MRFLALFGYFIICAWKSNLLYTTINNLIYFSYLLLQGGDSRLFRFSLPSKSNLCCFSSSSAVESSMDWKSGKEQPLDVLNLSFKKSLNITIMALKEFFHITAIRLTQPSHMAQVAVTWVVFTAVIQVVQCHRADMQRSLMSLRATCLHQTHMVHLFSQISILHHCHRADDTRERHTNATKAGDKSTMKRRRFLQIYFLDFSE